MSTQLIQKGIFTKRRAEIFETKVVYMSSILGKQFQTTIPYEDLSRNKESYVLIRQYVLMAVGVLALFTFASFMWRDDKEYDPNLWIFWGILFLISLAVFIGSIEKLWKIKVGYNIYLFFFQNKPGNNEVNEFLDLLFVTRDIYLRQTYFLEANKNLSYESQKSNLLWLRKSEVINGEEFQSGIDKLNEVFKNSELNKIGFN